MLSVCIIAKNEEKNIGRCLDSVKSIADEIVLVDTGSDDNTVNIATKYGCRIYKTLWNNNFSEVRNISLSKARYDFILVIDADEQLQNPNNIKYLINNAHQNVGGWFINVVSNSNSDSEYYSNSQVRLFRNNIYIRFSGAIHEQIYYSIINNNFVVESSNVWLLHYGYALEKQYFIKKQVRNLKILQRELAKTPDNSYYRLNLAKTFYALEDFPNAELEINRVINNDGLNDLEKVNILNHGALIANKLDMKEKSYERALMSSNILPQQFLANFICAELLSEKGKFAEAAELYKKSIADYNSDKNKLTGDIVPKREHIHYKAGLNFLKARQYNDAEIEFKAGIQNNYKSLQNLLGLANVYFKTGRFAESREIILKAKINNPAIAEIDEFLKKVERHLPKVKDETPLLTLSMIVKNEESFLKDCLESVNGIADEIVIVDTGSNDNTVEIAKQYTNKIFHYKWSDDFASARNEALKHSTGKWVLYMDADERIKIEKKALFKNLLESADEDIGGLIVTIESKHKKLDGSSELHRGGYPRIFRNYGYPNIHFKGRVHEQIAPSILDLKKSFADTDIIIEHLGYDRSYEEMDAKVRRNYKLLLQHVNEEPLNSYAWYQLGQTLARMKLNREAENAIRFALDTGNLNDSVYASATATLAQMEGNKKNFENALYYTEESLKKAPGQIYSSNLKGYALLYLGRFSEAEKQFEEVLQLFRSKRGVPKTGFDIDISEDIVLKGLEKARNRDNSY